MNKRIKEPRRGSISVAKIQEIFSVPGGGEYFIYNFTKTPMCNDYNPHNHHHDHHPALSPESLPDENSKRFVAVLNSKIETGRLFNALGHMAAGLSGLIATECESVEELCFLQYKDKSDSLHPSISHFPFIVLKAENSNQIRKTREEAIANNIPFTDFTDTMIVGTSKAQLEATASKEESELEYFGICMFGESEVIRGFTKRFSLYR